MRLPEAVDCETVGRSIGLSEEQILELSRLDKGVAAIFQNDWLETVLTKIDKCSERYEISMVKKNDLEMQKELVYLVLEELINESQSKKYDLKWLKDTIYSMRVNTSFQRALEKTITDFYNNWLEGSDKNILAETIYIILNCGDLFRMFEQELPIGIKKSSMLTPEIRKQGIVWSNKIYSGLDRYVNFLDKFVKDQVFMNLILYHIATSKKTDQYKVALYCAKNNK